MKPPRCHDCKHRRRRTVTGTSKNGAEPRVHKKPCDCRCHTPPEPPAPRQRRLDDKSRPSWWEPYEELAAC